VHRPRHGESPARAKLPGAHGRARTWEKGRPGVVAAASAAAAVASAQTCCWKTLPWRGPRLAGPCFWPAPVREARSLLPWSSGSTSVHRKPGARRRGCSAPAADARARSRPLRAPAHRRCSTSARVRASSGVRSGNLLLEQQFVRRDLVLCRRARCPVRACWTSARRVASMSEDAAAAGRARARCDTARAAAPTIGGAGTAVPAARHPADVVRHCVGVFAVRHDVVHFHRHFLSSPCPQGPVRRLRCSCIGH